MNWSEEPRELTRRVRARIRGKRYTMVPLESVMLHLFGRFCRHDFQWWPSIHGHPIVSSWRGARGAAGCHWTTYAPVK